MKEIERDRESELRKSVEWQMTLEGEARKENYVNSKTAAAANPITDVQFDIVCRIKT